MVSFTTCVTCCDTNHFDTEKCPYWDGSFNMSCPIKTFVNYNMSRDVRKPVFGVSDHNPFKPGCTATQDG